MEYNVNFSFDFDAGCATYTARCTRRLGFVPFEGMHIGNSKLLTVCQVYWVGGLEFNVTIANPCANWKSLEEAIGAIKRAADTMLFVPMEWRFA